MGHKAQDGVGSAPFLLTQQLVSGQNGEFIDRFANSTDFDQGWEIGSDDFPGSIVFIGQPGDRGVGREKTILRRDGEVLQLDGRSVKHHEIGSSRILKGRKRKNLKQLSMKKKRWDEKGKLWRM